VRPSTWLVRAIVTGTVIACGLGAWRAASTPASAQATAPAADQALGRELFQHDCAVCHGSSGEGSALGPSIATSGVADVDFMVSTGRMPISAGEHAPSKRRTPRYAQEQIDALVAYAATFVTGEPVPGVAVGQAELGAGGEVYRLNCASCHHATGSGGVLAYGVEVPPLDEATAVQVVEALRVGPAQMPAFSRDAISDQQAIDVAAYVQELRDPDDRGGFALGHLGPVPEGAVALLGGLGALVLLSRWLGTRDRPTEAGAGAVAHPGASPVVRAGVEGWMRSRADADPAMQAAVGQQTPEPAPASRPPPPDEDGLDLLTRDHDHFDRSLRELAAPPGAPTSTSDAGPRRRVDLARRIEAGLRRHEEAEEQHLWPIVRDVLPDGAARADRARDEGAAALGLVGRLVGTEPGTDDFERMVGELADVWRHHVAFEDDVFLQLRAVLPEDRRVALGRGIAGDDGPHGR
jgi:ubiquinol-cytochrome c reductase cytochrome c subunit